MRAPAVDLAGRTSLGGVAALLEGAALQVCSDTGAAHVAAAVGTPSAVVFLSGDPVRWAHPGHRVARVPVECSPCRHLACPIDHRCATRLAPADVLAAVDALAAPAHALP
jgi:ADP-heptose:LPS heptosyltransferase